MHASRAGGQSCIKTPLCVQQLLIYVFLLEQSPNCEVKVTFDDFSLSVSFRFMSVFDWMDHHKSMMINHSSEFKMILCIDIVSLCVGAIMESVRPW